jgi:hypothetical protein
MHDAANSTLHDATIVGLVEDLVPRSASKAVRGRTPGPSVLPGGGVAESPKVPRVLRRPASDVAPGWEGICAEGLRRSARPVRGQ